MYAVFLKKLMPVLVGHSCEDKGKLSKADL